MFKKCARLLGVLAFVGWTGTASASFIDINLSGWETYGGYGNAGNTSTSIFLPVGTNIIGAEYIDLIFESFGGSWNSELTLSLNDSSTAPSFWDTRIAGAPASPGVFGPVSADFANPGVFSSGPFTLTTGDLYIETYESFVDGVSPDARIRSGTLRVETDAVHGVPEPATLALFGLGLAGLGFARKKKKSA